MKAHELAKKLLECPDFEVVFTHELIECDFDKVEFYDIGYSEKRVFVTGEPTFTGI